MKKLMILLAILIAGNFMMAQDRDYQNAVAQARNGYYAKAVESIEKCINHEGFAGMKPGKQAKAWYQRAFIYETILQSGDAELIAKNPNAMEYAYESLMKCMENQEFFEDNKQDVYNNLNVLLNMYYTEGAASFEKSRFAEAVPLLKRAYDLAKSLNSPDANQILEYAAYGYVKLNDNDKAIEYYNILKDAGYESETMYSNLAMAYITKEQKDKALEVVTAGLEKYPSSEALIRENVNLKLSEGKGTEAVADLEKLLAARPDDATLLFALGTIFGDDTKEEMYNPEKALNYYKQAINVKPDYFDAIYNLGALYITMSNKIKEEADAITGVSKAELERYDALHKQANDLIQEGLPFVKQAYEAQPNAEIKSVLRSMYGRLNMLEEVKALDAAE